MAFFLFFEVVTFTTYGLIVRERDKNPKVSKSWFYVYYDGCFWRLINSQWHYLLYAFTGAFEWDALALLYS
jgi:formate hydrogenlyase subunit 3/multisubunit Na+/H+ antiporter MnhD subunit